MTTKPKARKFRIRRTPASQPGPVSDTAQTPSEDPRQDQQHPGPQSSGSSSSYTSEPASAAYDPETETETRAGMVSSASEMGAGGITLPVAVSSARITPAIDPVNTAPGMTVGAAELPR